MKRDMAERPEDPTIDARLEALTERSAARDRRHDDDRAVRYRQEREAADLVSWPFVVAGQGIERVAYAVAGFFAAGGFRGFLRRRDGWPS